MLVNTFGKKITASLVVKNSEFYIEVAKFVQAYTVILANPNEFLREIGGREMDVEKDKLSWTDLQNIMQKCDFGFAQVPTNSDLLVFYNYAIEMGSISKNDKRLATVDEIADAQKNYYNFVDEAKDRAEAEFLKQHRITKLREKEVSAINQKLSSFSLQKWIAFSLMIVAVIFFCLGVAGLVFNNPLVEQIGSLIPIWSKQYVGSIILIILSVLMFWLCDRWHLSSKQEYLKLDHASQLIFSNNDANFVAEQVLKYKLDALKRDLAVIQNEINDENKTYDVKANIEKLIETNSYYKKYTSGKDVTYSAEAKVQQQMTIDDSSVFEISEQPEQEIILEGQFDEEAYLEKFEKSKKKPKKLEKESEQEEKPQKTDVEEIEFRQKQQEDLERKLEETRQIEQQKQQENKKSELEQMEEYIDYLREFLGDDESMQRGK